MTLWIRPDVAGWDRGTLVGARASPDSGDGAPHPARGGARRRPRSPRRARRTRRAHWARASSAGWPRPSPSPTCPRSAPPTRRAPRSASATCSTPRARAAWWCPPSARRTGARSSTASPGAHGLDASMLEAIVMLESAGRPDARASDDLRSAAGLTQILAETGQNLLGHAGSTSRPPSASRAASCAGIGCAARGAAPARRRALRSGQGDRGDRALSGLRQGQARARRPRRRLLPHGRGQPAAGADGLRRGHRPLRPALLRLEPAAPRGGVAQARLAGRRLLDLPVAGARRARDHAPVSQRPRGARARGGAAVPQGLGRGGPAPARAHDGVRRPLRDRPGAGVRRAARDRREVLAPYGLRSTRTWASSRGA